MIKKLNGDQALAYGAVMSGVSLVTSYPGAPSSGTVECLIPFARDHKLYLEWSSNEKVAIEMAIGASIAGRRSLVCVKSVGMNAMLDPLMVLNLTPIHAGLVIILGDDPGAYGSQNDQDTRPLALLLKMPMIEPAGPDEALTMIPEVYRLSEQFQTPIIVRETRSFTQLQETLEVNTDSRAHYNLGLQRETWRFVPVPKNAVAKHRELNERLARFCKQTNKLPYNKICSTGKYGIVAVGFAYHKLLDLLSDDHSQNLGILKLDSLYPLPQDLISEFMTKHREILVFEESQSFVENQIKVIAQEQGLAVKIYGQHHFGCEPVGELFRWQMQQVLLKYIAGFIPVKDFQPANESNEQPHIKSNCQGCNYDLILDSIAAAAKVLNKPPVIVGDPGCLVTVADRLDAKYSMGSAIGVADGMSKAGMDERVIALFGDSSFFHTSIPALCNAVYNRSNIILIILDNKATTASGSQPNPGVGKDALGRDAPTLSIARIAQACGLKYIYEIGPENRYHALKERLEKVLQQPDMALLIVNMVFPKISS